MLSGCVDTTEMCEKISATMKIDCFYFNIYVFLLMYIRKIAHQCVTSAMQAKAILKMQINLKLV